MKTSIGILACAGLTLALALGGCAKWRSPSVGGETNWLVRCDDDGACERGSCLCGVCTQRCSESAECGGAFAGRCTRADDPAGELLCGPTPSPAVDAVCLPHCDATHTCGTGYACEDEVCVARGGTTPPPPGDGGDGGDARDARVDGCVPGRDSGCGANAQLIARVEQSRGVWDALVAANGSSYWYTEENCGGNGLRDGTTVQVDAGAARIVGKYQVAECPTYANRFESWTARTMEEAYAECLAIVGRNGSVTLDTDGEGVLKTCAGPENVPGCADNCGDGFVIGRRGFGSAPAELVGDRASAPPQLDSGL